MTAPSTEHIDRPSATHPQVSHPRSVALIGSYVPRRCGIATFTHDLSMGIASTVFQSPIERTTHVGIVAMNDTGERYAYGPQVVYEINDSDKEDYRAAADFLNHSKFDVVCVQHEYGIFGGSAGDYLLALLDGLTKPVVATLHTVLAEPNEDQRRVLVALCERAGAVVVMAQRAERMLHDVFGVPFEKIRLIHHGVPDVPFGDTEPYKTRFEVSGRPVVLTFGLLSANKGIETMLEALAQVVPDHRDVAYIVLGATHPAVRRESGESYRLSLEKRAVSLGIEQNVIFHNRYVSLEDLCEYLCATDVYVTPYRNPAQIVSGTLAYSVACGTAVISTPYWYAEEVLSEGRGRLVPFNDVDAMARELRTLLEDEAQRLELRKRAYHFGRQMTWPRVSTAYAELFERVCQPEVAEVVTPKLSKKPTLRRSLPEVRLEHLYRLTDDTGLLQHSIHATPDRRHGYSIDDVARGLIVAAMRHTLFKDEEVLKPFHTYLSYIHYARNDHGRYRNFMSYERRWLDTSGSDDCQGRVRWALGYVSCHAPDEMSRDLCQTLFRQGTPELAVIESIRPAAFGILGCHYYLRATPDDAEIASAMHRQANRIVRAFDENASDDWVWFENTLTYANGRVPQALILAGLQFDDREMIGLGCRALEWLLEEQTGDGGQISIIGNDGWYRRGGEKARYDQQPIEIAGLVGACKAAYRATDDARYLKDMRRCFDWFLGSNDVGATMIDFKSRGCHDGLTPDGVNANQGAESLLSWLLALLIMHEMQTGDPTSAG